MLVVMDILLLTNLKTRTSWANKTKGRRLTMSILNISRLMVSRHKFYLFVAIDRICKYADIEIHKQQSAKVACNLLVNTAKEHSSRSNR